MLSPKVALILGCALLAGCGGTGTTSNGLGGTGTGANNPNFQGSYTGTITVNSVAATLAITINDANQISGTDTINQGATPNTDNGDIGANGQIIMYSKSPSGQSSRIVIGAVQGANDALSGSGTYLSDGQKYTASIQLQQQPG